MEEKREREREKEKERRSINHFREGGEEGKRGREREREREKIYKPFLLLLFIALNLYLIHFLSAEAIETSSPPKNVFIAFDPKAKK
jgi:hypothetical protein